MVGPFIFYQYYLQKLQKFTKFGGEYKYYHTDLLINQIDKKAMGKSRPATYNRVNCSQKSMLRRLVLVDKMSIKHAAHILEINYSTAKSIMFNDRKNHTHLTISSTMEQSTEKIEGIRAVVCLDKPMARPTKIQIVSTTGQRHERLEMKVKQMIKC